MEILRNPVENFKTLLEQELSAREKLATCLHSEIFPSLLAIKVNLSVKNKRMTEISQKDFDLEKEMKAINDIMENLRSFYYKLYPSLLKHLGLFKCIHSNLLEIAEKYSTEIEVSYNNVIDEIPAKKDWKLQVYFVTESIIEYLISNFPSSCFLVELKQNENEISIKMIRHDTKAAVSEVTKSESLDQKYLSAIEARLDYLKATIRKETNWNNIVAVTIPLNF